MSVRRFLPRLEKKFAGLTVETIAEDGSFSGYASLFGEVDLGKDAIEAGAFEKSVRERGAAGIRMLWQHDPNQPIGVWTQVREDKRGLYVEGKLARNVAKAAEVLELMRSGAIDGLSIGFRTVKARTGTGGIRHIHEADLWEISVVTFPMLPSARVGQVKSLAGAAMPDRDHTCQTRILWNIKANEVLIAALKLSPQSDHNRRWMAQLEEENEALKSRSLLLEPFQLWYRKYNPDQPRVPAGNSDGGQWTDGGGGGAPLKQDVFDRRWSDREKPDGTIARGGRFGGALPAKKPDIGPKAPDGTPVQLVQSRGGVSAGLPQEAFDRRWDSTENQTTASSKIARSKIVSIAKSYVGSADFQQDNEGRSKCNFFVSVVTSKAGASPGLPNGWISGNPPTAGQWANPDYDIPGWKVLNATQTPEAGDVVAQRIEYRDTSTGHVMIVIAPNEFIGTGTPPEGSGLPHGTIVHKRGLTRLGPENLAHGPLVYRRWVGR